MKFTILFSVLVLSLIGCEQLPTTEEMSAIFFESELSFKQLADTIKSETIDDDRECIVFAPGQINNFQKDTNSINKDVWRDISKINSELTFYDVLGKAGTTNERYNFYIHTLKDVNAERITYCRHRGLEVSVNSSMVIRAYSSGLAMSDCWAQINWSPILLHTGGRGSRSDEQFTEITPLKDGWYIRISCY